MLHDLIDVETAAEFSQCSAVSGYRASLIKCVSQRISSLCYCALTKKSVCACDQLKLLNLYIKRAVAQKNSESSENSSQASSPVSVVETMPST